MIAPRQHGPHVWRGDDLLVDPSWTWQLDEVAVDELLQASQPLADADEAELATMTAADFPLPTLATELHDLRRRLVGGRGFELIRGFPADDVSPGQAAAAFVGIGAHLGSARRQNAAGDLLGHVRNVGLDASDPEVRIYQTNARQTFHTDSADVVGLMCLETAARGGDSLLVSAATVYNEVLRRAPELAAVLFEPVATDRRGEVPAGAEPWFSIPVLSWYDDLLTVLYQRQYIESAQRFDAAPRLTATMVAALDLLDEIANAPGVHLSMRLEVGDIQFVHNHRLLHDRTAFVDRPGSPRHLLRLWLSMPGDRRLPPVFAQRYGSVTIGDRGGIVAG